MKQLLLLICLIFYKIELIARPAGELGALADSRSDNNFGFFTYIAIIVGIIVSGFLSACWISSLFDNDNKYEKDNQLGCLSIIACISSLLFLFVKCSN